MEKYIALLRGINVSGKNKISMAELKKEFEQLGFLTVATYINSGNVIFSSDIQMVCELIEKIECMIKKKFELNIPVTVLPASELFDIFMNAPAWWNAGNKEIYDNTIFMIPPTTVEEVLAMVGEEKAEYEQVASYGNVIFWSVNLKSYHQSRWSKIARLPINNSVTVRNANTVKKLLELSQK